RRCEDRMTGDESRMTSHEFDETYSVSCSASFDSSCSDDVDCRRIGTFKSKTAVDEMNVVVDGFGDSNNRNGKSSFLHLRSDLHSSSDSTVSSHDKQHLESMSFKVIDDFSDILTAP